MINTLHKVIPWSYWTGYMVVSFICGLQVKIDSKLRGVETSLAPNTAVSNREGNDSSGNSTRSMFYRLMFFALVSRTVLIPVGVIVESNYWKFVAKTFPEMTFVSAWTLLVSFLVQLVGTASGTGIYTEPSLTVQMIAYGIYLVLTLVSLHTYVGLVSIYAILCVIYFILFGYLLYFGPRLVSILYPSLLRRSSLALRLICCCIICVLVFAAKVVELAQKVFIKPNEEKDLIKYIALELFPVVALLIMMFPSRGMQRQKSFSGNNDSDLIGKESSAMKGLKSVRKDALLIARDNQSYGAV